MDFRGKVENDGDDEVDFERCEMRSLVEMSMAMIKKRKSVYGE